MLTDTDTFLKMYTTVLASCDHLVKNTLHSIFNLIQLSFIFFTKDVLQNDIYWRLLVIQGADDKLGQFLDQDI